MRKTDLFKAVRRDVTARKDAFSLMRGLDYYADTWDEQTIESRQKQLASIATGIWRIDFGR